MVSLYTIAGAKIEVGRYNLNLDEAVKDFLDTAASFGLKPRSVNNNGFKTVVKFQGLNEGLGDLLGEVAKVIDLHGDPPDEYLLEEIVFQKDQYVNYHGDKPRGL